MTPGCAVEGLRPVDQTELTSGQVLPGDLCDRTGRVLLHAGETLSAEGLARVRGVADGLYAGPNWPKPPGAPDTPSPEELMEALRSRRPGHGGEKGRRHARHAWRVRLRLTIQEGSGEWGRRQVEVTTLDISVSGFAFEFPQFINSGTVVYARFDTLPNRPAMKGVVRNCTHVSARMHRVGVEFIKLVPGEAIPYRGGEGEA
jgi:hypothetical protein